MRIVAFALTAAAVAALGVPATAQSFTDSELLRLFEAQRDAFKAARASGGKTRGLEVVTLGEEAPATETATLATPETEEGSTTVASTDTTPGTGAAPGTIDQPNTESVASADTSAGERPTSVGVFAEELQVNVNITFDFDSADLRDDQKPQLTQLCSVMKASDINLFQIIGHTDASGTDAYNERLSQLRAEEVKRYFVSDCGIDAARLEALGMGERFLSDPNDPRAGQNRRVEFQALS